MVAVVVSVAIAALGLSSCSSSGSSAAMDSVAAAAVAVAAAVAAMAATITAVAANYQKRAANKIAALALCLFLKDTGLFQRGRNLIRAGSRFCAAADSLQLYHNLFRFHSLNQRRNALKIPATASDDPNGANHIALQIDDDFRRARAVRSIGISHFVFLPSSVN